MAVLGGIGDAPDPAVVERVIGDVASWQPDLVVWTGDAVKRGTRGAWEGAAAALAPLAGVPWIAVSGPRDGRGDRRLRGHGRLWPDPTPRAVDLAVGGTTWRVLVLDARPGAAIVDQAFWIPKVTGPAAVYDDLVVVSGWPVRSAVEAPRSPAAELLELAEECSDGRLRLALTGGAGTNELFARDGAFGPMLVGAGNAGGDGPPIGEAELDQQVPAFAWGQRLDRLRASEADAPLQGWWALELGAGEADLTFLRWSPADRLGPTTRAEWSAGAGWRVVAVEAAEPR